MQTAVLLSGGLDSAVLLAAEAARHGDGVQPIYVSVGLAWEAAERAAVRALLATDPLRARTRPLVSLTVDMRDVYEAGHWAIEGRPPGYHTPDEEVYLPGRNIVLLGKAAVYCAAAGIDRLVLGTLAHNPFPDATPAFRSAMADALSLGLAHPLAIDAPFALATKAEVITRGVALGRAAPAHAVVHEAARAGSGGRVSAGPLTRPVPSVRSLRDVQQVPRASRRLSRGRVADSTEYAERDTWGRR